MTPIHELQYTSYNNMQYLLYKLDLSDAVVSKSPADFLTPDALRELLLKQWSISHGNS